MEDSALLRRTAVTSGACDVWPCVAQRVRRPSSVRPLLLLAIRHHSLIHYYKIWTNTFEDYYSQYSIWSV